MIFLKTQNCKTGREDPENKAEDPGFPPYEGCLNQGPKIDQKV